MLMKILGKLRKSNYLIGIRTRNLPTSSIVPEPTTLPLLVTVHVYIVIENSLAFHSTTIHSLLSS
jgi:hypothetical protein